METFYIPGLTSLQSASVKKYHLVKKGCEQRHGGGTSSAHGEYIFSWSNYVIFYFLLVCSLVLSCGHTAWAETTGSGTEICKLCLYFVGLSNVGGSYM